MRRLDTGRGHSGTHGKRSTDDHDVRWAALRGYSMGISRKAAPTLTFWLARKRYMTAKKSPPSRYHPPMTSKLVGACPAAKLSFQHSQNAAAAASTPAPHSTDMIGIPYSLYGARGD